MTDSAVTVRERPAISEKQIEAVNEISALLLPMEHLQREAVLKAVAALFDCGMSFTLKLPKESPDAAR